jgi:hypothetical protein
MLGSYKLIVELQIKKLTRYSLTALKSFMPLRTEKPKSIIY